MKYKLILFIILSLTACIHSQDNPNNVKDLKTDILKNDININISPDLKIAEGSKSPGISLILSLIVPGAGHLYAGRMDIGKYFLTAEGALWLGFAGVNIYGDALQNDARSFAVVHSGLSKDGKSDDYFADVGNFNNIYEYNNYRLSRGEYDKLYNINAYYWNWDNVDNRTNYDEQRRKSERMYNSTKIFTTGMILNRIASAVSAFLITKTAGKIDVKSEFTGSNSGRPDGFRLNFIKTF
jgi:hypothetical protein